MKKYSLSGVFDMYFDFTEGLQANEPAELSKGSFYFSTDTGRLVYGKADGTKQIIGLELQIASFIRKGTLDQRDAWIPDSIGIWISEEDNTAYFYINGAWK